MKSDIQQRLDRELAPKKGEHLIRREDALPICQLSEQAQQILEDTDFASQPKYNYRRGLRVANLINDLFSIEHLAGKRILELGPGHYAFALLARYLGAQVVCIERDPAFVALGRYLGFEVRDCDFNDLSLDMFDEPFDGMWIKGTFNSCNYETKDGINAFVERITPLVKPEGWAWCVTVNKDTNGHTDEWVEDRIEYQRECFVNHGWRVDPIEDEEDRRRYAIKYSGCYYHYTRNLFDANGGVSQRATSNVPEVSVPEASDGRPFNKVSRIWQPTVEYYENPWEYFIQFINILKTRDAKFLTMSEALEGKYDPADVNILLDHHIDFYPVETEVMLRWELENGVRSNVYLFAHSPYEDTLQKKKWTLDDLNIPFYQELERAGFEIGYHQNAVGQVRAEGLNRDYRQELSQETIEKAKEHFARDVELLRRYFDIKTFIPHGGGEANAKLLSVPCNAEDLVWVYNNNRQNDSIDPPLKWKNYSDSSSSSPQRMRGYRSHYIARRSNLHLAAYLAEPGLNHILVHPGRYSKGMPYEQFSSSEKIADDYCGINLEFQALYEDRLPIDMPRLIRSWEGQQGTREREASWAQRPDSYPIAACEDRCYVLSDSWEVLRNHLAVRQGAVPFFMHHRRIDSDEKNKYSVSRPSAKYVHMPVPLIPQTHEHQAEIDRVFMEQFRSFYNEIFAIETMTHLLTTPIIFDALHLINWGMRQKQELEHLPGLLERYRSTDDFFLKIQLAHLPQWQWRRLAGIYLNHPHLTEKFRMGFLPEMGVTENGDSCCFLVVHSRSLEVTCELQDVSTTSPAWWKRLGRVIAGR